MYPFSLRTIWFRKYKTDKDGGRREAEAEAGKKEVRARQVVSRLRSFLFRWLHLFR